MTHYTNSKGEQWRPVSGFEGLYEVSDLGRIRSLTARRQWAAGRILSPAATSKGYRFLNLCGRGRKVRAYVSVLVLTAFVGPRPAGHEAAHEDGDRENNTLRNLAWKTPAANAADKFRTGTQPLGTQHHNAKLSEAAVLSIRQDTRTQRVIAADHGVTQSLISQLKLGKGWAHV